MPIPSMSEVKKALLAELKRASGKCTRKDIIEKLAQLFELTQDEREKKYPSDGKIFYHKVNDAAVSYTGKAC